MSKLRDSFLGPTLILAAICAISALLLAGAHQITLPLIERAAVQAAENARIAVLPDADGFTVYDGALPSGILEAYTADNGAGYVFTAEVKGFGGTVKFMIGLDGAGKVTGIEMFEHGETPGLGTKIGAERYLSRFYGDAQPDAVDAMAGATVTSNALKSALNTAQAAYDSMTGGM